MSSSTPIPSHIAPHHWQEWAEGSQVSPHITALNVAHYEGQHVLELLLGTHLEQLAKGTEPERVSNPELFTQAEVARLEAKAKRKARGSSDSAQYATRPVQRLFSNYEPLTKGGWGVSGLDPLKNWHPSDYFRFKPDPGNQRLDLDRRGTVKTDSQGNPKRVKYESPKGEPTRATFLRVSYAESVLTAERIKDSHETALYAFRSRFYSKLEEAAKTKGQQLEGTQQPAVGGLGDRSEQTFAGVWFAAARGQFQKAHQILSEAPDPLEDEGFWPWVDRFVLPVAIVEGEKKAGAMLSLGIPAIAIPGIRNAVRTRDKDGNRLLEPYLIPELKHFATESREITVCFDYEPRQQQRRELDHEIEKIKGLFSRDKCKVRVLELPGPQKGVDDFIVAHGGEAFTALYDGAPSFELWTVLRYSRLTYKANLTLNQRYLGDLPIPRNAKLVAIKSPKGTGKTESFRSLVEEASANGQRTLLITHRVQLGQSICGRVYLPYVTELKLSEEGDLLGFGVCVDSLHPESQARFNAEDWDDALVIIDEVEQVIWHLLEGDTEVKKHRIEILNQLRVLFNAVLKSERGRIILSDADLSDLSLRFVDELLESGTPFKPYVVVNQWKPTEPWQIHVYRQSRPVQWLAALLEHIEQGNRALIVTQSQKTKSRWSTTTLEKLLNERFPHLKVLRIDSHSVVDPSHPAYLCTSNLNEVLKNYDIAIASPTIETGVSIDIRGHFNSVWGCAQGVLSENSTRQFLARLRDPVPRHLWCQSFGVGHIGNGATSIKSLLAAEYKLAQKHIQVLNYASAGEGMLSSFGGVLYVWAAMACRINAGRVHYRDAVLHGLKTEGHTLIDVTEVLPVEQATQQIDEIRLKQHQAECEGIAESEDITERQHDELKGKKTKTKTDWYKERKFEIRERYGQEVTPDLVSKDIDGWYPKLRLFYYLTMGSAFLEERDRTALDSQVKSGAAWLPTLNRSQLSLKVKALDYLGIKKLLNVQEHFNGGTRADDAEIEDGIRTHYDDAHPILLEIAKLARQFKWEIKTILRLTISDKMSPIQIAQALLGKVGLKLNCVCQEGPRGARQRIYKFLQPQDGRAEIFNGWYLRDLSAREAGDAVHTPGNKNTYSEEAAA